MEQEKYVAPQIEIIEIEVEKGFAVSIPTGDDIDEGTTGSPGRRGEWGDLW